MAQFFLIHGASHGAWCWERVIAALEARGHTAVATDQPGLGADTTPQADVTWDMTVEKLSNDLNNLQGEVIIVAHSMGGTLAAQLTELHPAKVRATVYLAATLPRDGESCLSNTLEDCSASRIFFAHDELGISPETAVNLFPLLLFGDCSEEVTREAMSKLGPQPMTVFGGTVSLSEESEGSVPRFYIETLKDLVITPGHQRIMHTRRPCQRVFSLQSGHSAMYSAPDDVADILNEISTSLIAPHLISM
ncbi:alpha/beta fold hydrolase [Rhodococcus sp. BH2-1]|nr:alpha/beta fold hydrolase [Rhodococcus sp. BH2-1]